MRVPKDSLWFPDKKWYHPLLKVEYVYQSIPIRIRLKADNGPLLEINDRNKNPKKALPEGYISYYKNDQYEQFSSCSFYNRVDFPYEEFLPTHYLIYEMDMAESFGEPIRKFGGREGFIIPAADLPLAKLSYNPKPFDLTNWFNGTYFKFYFHDFIFDINNKNDFVRNVSNKAVPVKAIISNYSDEEYEEYPTSISTSQDLLMWKKYRNEQRDWVTINENFSKATNRRKK